MVPWWFSVIWVPKTFTYSHKKLGFWLKNGQIWSEICIFDHFGPNIAIFCTFCPMPDQKTMRTRCLGGFSGMWVPNLLLPLVKIWNFGPQKAKFGPQYAFSGTYWPCRFIWCPVGWWLWHGLFLARHLFTLSIRLLYLSHHIIFLATI